MPDNITCELCGGKDFYKEAGFYYCNECQTQTREIREQVFDTEPETAEAPKKTTKRIKTRRSKKNIEQITSWECYNYILLGLVNELIELGANPELKPTVKFLWFKYLEKLEVINKAGKPRLQALNSRVDAEIIYGRSNKRKRVKKSPSLSPSSGSDSQQARTKAKKAMVMADYEEYSRISSTMDSSVHNQSLQSLKGSTDSGTHIQNKYLLYNRPAKKVLLRTMTKGHFHKHRKDVHSDLDCHKYTYKIAPYSYTRSPCVLSRNKMYGLLYLGLLLNRDAIQLGDLLRFVREGHLSYNRVEHFIPEDKADKKLNMRSYSRRKMPLKSKGLRIVTAKLAVALKVASFVKMQNLPELSRRYCKELGLPDEVSRYVLRHMSLAKSFMNVTQKSTIIPNYEARAMCFIIFVLKLLLGFDDKTEHHLSNFAHRVNTRGEDTGKVMFEFEKWAKHLKYRKVVLSAQHLPTQLSVDNTIKNAQLYTEFMTKNCADVEEKQLRLELEVLHQLLGKVKDVQVETEGEMLDFEPTLTPNRDYTQTILKSTVPEKHNYNRELLGDFSNTTFHFLFYPSHHLKKLGEKNYNLTHGGANENSSLIKIRDVSQILDKNSETYVTLQIVNKDKSLPDSIARDFEYVRSNSKMYANVNGGNIKGNLKDLNKHLKERYPDEDISDVFLLNTTTKDTPASSPHNYYNCEAKYWLFTENTRRMNLRDYKRLSEILPRNFTFVLGECARIIEQTELDLYSEFCHFELYMCYFTRYSTRMQRNIERLSHVNFDPVLKNLIERAQRLW